MATSHCVDLADMSVLFDHGVTDAELSARLAALPQERETTFQLQGSRWVETANDPAVEPGEAFVLTYSFVSDGTLIPGFLGEGDSESVLEATTNAAFPGGFVAFKQVVADAFARWSSVTNITYVEVSDDGAAFDTLTPGQSGTRGDIRISMHPVGGSVLAYNFFPAFGGDMVIDSTKTDTLFDPTGDFRSLRNTLMHEHGHGIGLDHVHPVNETKLMEPNLSLLFDGPQEDDIRAVQLLYGDGKEANDTPETASDLGRVLNRPESGSFVVDHLALEQQDSVDNFTFSVVGNAFGTPQVSLHVEPVGSTYEQGPVAGILEEINAAAARDLHVTVSRREPGASAFTQLVVIDEAPAGVAEVISAKLMHVEGEYLVSIASSDPESELQSYRLVFDVEVASQPAMAVKVGDRQLAHGDSFDFGELAIGQLASTDFEILSTGNEPLEIDAIQWSGAASADFDGGRDAVSVRPTASGQREALLSIRNNSADSEFVIRLQATGVEPVGQAEDVGADCDARPQDCTGESVGSTEATDASAETAPGTVECIPFNIDCLCGAGGGLPLLLAMCGTGFARRRKK